jgi:predicted dehydrogenase
LTRWVVWGAGSIGTRHLRNLRALGERDVVALRRSDTPLDGDLGSIRVRTDLAEARGDGEAIAIVCTPTAHHAADALAAVEAGCDVLVEKPLSDRLDGLDRLRSTAASRARVVGVAYCLRFHPAVARVRETLATGDLGRVLAVTVWCGQHLADWHPGSDHTGGYSARRDLGGGVLLDLSHELDYLGWLFGPAEAVTANVRNTGTLSIETEDVADLVVRLRGGLVASCHLDYLARPAVRGGWVACERGSLRWDLLRSTVERSSAGGWEHLPVAGTDMYVAELDAFAAAVAARTAFAVDLDAGARTVRLALAARESSRERREIAVR